jgi:hypothetical protein
MNDQTSEGVEVKTCPACGGTWPSERRNCLACGASLEEVPARPAGEEPETEPLDWTWLDAMAQDGPASETSQPSADEQRKGCLSQLLPGLK